MRLAEEVAVVVVGAVDTGDVASSSLERTSPFAAWRVCVDDFWVDEAPARRARSAGPVEVRLVQFTYEFLLSHTLTANCNALSGFIPTASGGDGTVEQFCANPQSCVRLV